MKKYQLSTCLVRHYFLLILLTMFFVNGFCQPPDPRGNEEALGLEYDPCATSNISVTYNSEKSNVINLDCPEKSKVLISLIFDNGWGCLGNCSYSYKLYSNDNIISEGNTKNLILGIKKLDLTLDPTRIIKFSNSSETILKVEIYSTCSTTKAGTITSLVNTTNFPIQTIHSGKEYYKRLFVGASAEQICELTPSTEKICCNPSRTITTKFKNVSLTEVGGSIEFSASVTGPTQYLLKSILNLKGILGKKSSTSNEKEIVSTIIGKEGVCVFAGIIITFNVYEHKYYIADCDDDPNNDKKTGAVDVIYEEVSKDPYTCYTSPYNNCTPPKTTIKQGNNFNFLAEDCSGSLFIESFGPGVDPNNIYAEWKSESGIKYKGHSLQNVPFGTYTLTLTNECCEKFSQTVYLCPTQNIASPWIYNQQSGQWCADFNCGDGVLRSSCLINRCVTPDDIQTFYINGKCRERHFYKGEELGIAEANDKEATKTTEYNTFFGKCVYKYYCDDPNSPEEVIESYPESSNWVYEEGICKLNVMCDGTLLENVEQMGPIINYTWEDFFNKCVASYVNCANNLISQNISTNPTQISGWSWYNGPFTCYRTVTCDNGNQFTDYGVATTIEVYDPDPNCVFQYNQEIYCDGVFVGIFDPCEGVQNPSAESRNKISSNVTKFVKTESGIYINCFLKLIIGLFILMTLMPKLF